jgi:hypothetical protein
MSASYQEIRAEELESNQYQDTRTGKWTATCPLCEFFTDGYTGFGAMGNLIEHMNEAHPGGPEPAPGLGSHPDRSSRSAP